MHSYSKYQFVAAIKDIHLLCVSFFNLKLTSQNIFCPIKVSGAISAIQLLFEYVRVCILYGCTMTMDVSKQRFTGNHLYRFPPPLSTSCLWSVTAHAPQLGTTCTSVNKNNFKFN